MQSVLIIIIILKKIKAQNLVPRDYSKRVRTHTEAPAQFWSSLVVKKRPVVVFLSVYPECWVSSSSVAESGRDMELFAQHCALSPTLWRTLGCQ